MQVNYFVSQLERRMEWLENYRQIQVDAGLKRGYAILEAVRESCPQVTGGELMGAGRRRAKILVETLEERYKEALATKETLEHKAQASMRLMESWLADLEAGAHALRESGISSVVDEGWRRMDVGMERGRKVLDEGMERARQMRQSIEHAIARAREHGLICYEDLPQPWQVNPFILRGYRFTDSKISCLKSTISLSNETINIWSHFLGLILILTLAFYVYPLSHTFSSSTKTDIFIAFMFFFAATKCLVCSTVWHTMNSISNQTLLERFACVDYTGISLLIAASIMTTEYTAFYCEPLSRLTYISLTFTLGILGVILPWHPTFNRPDLAWARVGFYVSLAATGFAPMLQLSLTRGVDWTFYFYAPVTKSILVYLAGACVYASQLPERWWPGAFDYVGGSHNIWHVAVLGGILFHYLAMQEFFAKAFLRAGSECSIY
jgi:adiponectin receptor